LKQWFLSRIGGPLAKPDYVYMLFVVLMANLSTSSALIGSGVL
jgi:hypothetical protein